MDAVIAAIIGGVFLAVAAAIPLYLPKRRHRREARYASETYARELNKQLAKQYEDRISYLEATVVDRDGRIRALETVLDGKRRTKETTDGR